MSAASWTVYLLELERPLGDPSRPRCSARFYVGMTHDLGARLRAHRQGRRGCEGGANLTAAARERGIGFRLVRTWGPFETAAEARVFERRLKRAGHFDRLERPTQRPHRASEPVAMSLAL